MIAELFNVPVMLLDPDAGTPWQRLSFRLKRLRRRAEVHLCHHSVSVEYDEGWPMLMCSKCGHDLPWDENIASLF